MIRTAQAIAVLAVLAAAGAVQAAPSAPGLRVAYRVSDLATSTGREEIKTRFAAAADSWCRANPVAGTGTVASCKDRMQAELDRKLDLEVRAYAKARPNFEFARR